MASFWATSDKSLATFVSNFLAALLSANPSLPLASIRERENLLRVAGKKILVGTPIFVRLGIREKNWNLTMSDRDSSEGDERGANSKFNCNCHSIIM